MITSLNDVGVTSGRGCSIDRGAGARWGADREWVGIVELGHPFDGLDVFRVVRLLMV